MSDTEHEISLRLKLARDAKGLSQEELGRKLGYQGTSAKQMAFRLEQSPPQAWLRLRLLVEELEVSADWLLGRGERLPGPDLGSSALADRELQP